MDYCTADDVGRYVLQAYLDKAEELSPGILGGMISQASREVDDYLRSRYAVPLPVIPAIIRRITAVLSGYRCLGAITSLMDSFQDGPNDLVYIQRMANQAQEDLSKIASGGILLDLGGSPEPVIIVQAPPRLFGPDAWEKY